MAKPELLAIKNHEVKMTAWGAFVRIFLGAFWLFEVTIGHNWKTAVYYLLKVAVIETGKMKMVSMDLAVLFGFVSFGLYMYKEKADQILIVLGFTRYEPLMIGYIIAVWALDGGSMFSFDKLKNKEPQIGIKIPNMMIIVLIAISLVMVIAANVDGILPDGYKTSMGPVMGAMVAILCALLALAGLMQNGFKFSLKSDSNMKNKSISG